MINLLVIIIYLFIYYFCNLQNYIFLIIVDIYLIYQHL